MILINSISVKFGIMMREYIWHNSKFLAKIENLPYGIRSYYCYENSISELENLPITLKNFQCYDNKILKISNLPPNLKLLHVGYNQIAKIENLPWHLEDLWIVMNPVTKIINLPNTLYLFFFDKNIISPKNNSSKVKPFTLKSIVINYILDH
jgi:hypothetical protein